MTKSADRSRARSFRTPFAGHLAGYLAENEVTSPARPDLDTYTQFLVERWQALLEATTLAMRALFRRSWSGIPRCCPARDSSKSRALFSLVKGA